MVEDQRGRSRLAVLLTHAIVVLLIAMPLTSSAAGHVSVQEIRFWSYPEYTRIVITLSELAEFSSNRLNNPDRLYFDLKGAVLNKDLQKTITVANGMLKTVRAGQYTEATARIVLDLEAMKNYRVLTLHDPDRLVIDIFGARQGNADRPLEVAKKRIVLDPGHGGHDPGAVGPKNVYEKDVVLDIGLKLRKILEEDGSFEVFLTRDKDVYLTLEERTAIANSKNADLFVSIHANASLRKDARGIETYLLNWTSDDEAMRVAARENAISFKRMKKMQQEMDIVEIIKSDLLRETKRDESIKLANYIQRSLVKEMSRSRHQVVDHGVKQALFYVLFGAQMPSALVEVSFISNPQEEKLLATGEYREDLASSIAKGIVKYMKAMPEGQTIASVKPVPAP